MSVVLGFSCKYAVMADLDNTPFSLVKQIAECAVKRFRLGGFLILKSSAKHYHLVFDKPCTWNKVVKVISWIAIMSGRSAAWKYVCMQGIKGYCTLRVSPKPLSPQGVKPSPRIVYRHGTQDSMTKAYLEVRSQASKISRSLNIYKK
ncbi:MAG: hypothetical protein QXL10_01795 [Candidatus Bathyarchaeia archaeon]